MVSFHSSDGGDDGPLEEVEAGIAEVARLWSASHRGRRSNHLPHSKSEVFLLYP